jgi:uncharacterized protein (DUF3820 family)
MISPEVIPFGKYKGQPVEVVAADTDYCEWLTAQKWFKGKYQSLYRTLTSHGTEPAASTAPPLPVFIGETEPASAIPETAEYWPPWEEPPVPGCLAESGIPVSGLVWCPVHEEYEELCDGAPAVRLAGAR